MRADLVNRLRGVYTIPVNDGAGPLNGSDTFTRAFPMPPINKEAADEIERLRGEVERLTRSRDFMQERLEAALAYVADHEEMPKSHRTAIVVLLVNGRPTPPALSTEHPSG